MWDFHGNLWAKGGTFWGTSYLKAHLLGNHCPDFTYVFYKPDGTRKAASQIMQHKYGECLGNPIVRLNIYEGW
ncbi:hypothetical protein E2C01_066905 [Portunus trituberculatus]|uniref:Uncharacterized protein n=1 Tax=Portunus trituberculatus TaxID=210409 RepID=A0A5B7HR95_PORTR|nr:hypothetical protein [Portunus trituberculatus]